MRRTALLLAAAVLAVLPITSLGQTGDEPLTDALVPPEAQRGMPSRVSPSATTSQAPKNGLRVPYIIRWNGRVPANLDRLHKLVQVHKAELKKLEAKLRALREEAARRDVEAKQSPLECPPARARGKEEAQEEAVPSVSPEIERRLRELEKKTALLETLPRELKELRDTVQNLQPVAPPTVPTTPELLPMPTAVPTEKDKFLRELIKKAAPRPVPPMGPLTPPTSPEPF